MSSGGSGRGIGGGAGIQMLLGLLSKFGVKGMIIAVIVGAVLWKLGVVDPSQLLGGGTSGAVPNSPRSFPKTCCRLTCRKGNLPCRVVSHSRIKG